MNPFDILIVTILAYGLIRGIFRGVVREIFSVIGVLGGFYGAYTYYPHMAQLISSWITTPEYQKIISYLAIFSAVVIVVGILAVVIKYLLNIAFLGWLDRLGGAVFGFVKGCLVVCILFIVLAAFLPKESTIVKNSALAPHVSATSEILAKVLSKEMKTNFTLKIKDLQKFWQTR